MQHDPFSEQDPERHEHDRESKPDERTDFHEDPSGIGRYIHPFLYHVKKIIAATRRQE
jgi:hypothetical protein